MESGKLTSDQLKASVLDFADSANADLVVGPGLGEDSAVIRWQAPYLVACSDPVTGAGTGAGSLLVDVNVNDLACKGAEPLYLLVTLILPPEEGPETVASLMKEISGRCKALGVTLAGGHTEFNADYHVPVLCATALGAASRPMSLKDARVGDKIIATKHVGLEGMSILAHDRPDLLRSFMTEEELERIKSWREQLSVLPESRVLRGVCRCMHDPTEGGFDGGVLELARGAGLGVEIDDGVLPVHPLTRRAAVRLGFNPRRLIASGTMLAVVPPGQEQQALDLLARAGIDAVTVGRCVRGDGNLQEAGREELWGLLARKGTDDGSHFQKG